MDAGWTVVTRIKKDTLELMTALSSWGDEMLRLEPETMMKIMKLGSRIQKLVRSDKRKKSP